VDFPHGFSGHQTKQSLIYDVQEPFRWIGDVTTIESFESGVLDLKDFYFAGDNYRYHIEIDAKKRFLELLKGRFNLGVKHNGKACKWDTVILNKLQELARFLLFKSGSIDFLKPAPDLRRSDTAEIRRRILELTQSEAGKLGIGKSTLHHLRKNADRNQPFRIYKPTIRKLVAV